MDEEKIREESDLLRREAFAALRTELANERTALAYLRTSLTFAVAGVSAIQFIAGPVSHAIGVALCVGAIVVLVVGAMRFRSVRRRIPLFSSESL